MGDSPPKSLFGNDGFSLKESKAATEWIKRNVPRVRDNKDGYSFPDLEREFKETFGVERKGSTLFNRHLDILREENENGRGFSLKNKAVTEWIKRNVPRVRDDKDDYSFPDLEREFKENFGVERKGSSLLNRYYAILRAENEAE